MLRRTERDVAWMARIIARIDRSHLLAILAEARFQNPSLEQEALRLLEGRRRRLLERFLTRLSPLTHATVTASDGDARLCLEDAALVADVAARRARRYRALAWLGEGSSVPLAVALAGRGPCVALPRASGASRQQPRYLIVDVTAKGDGLWLPPARVHLYALGPAEYKVVGLERPSQGDRP